MGGSDRDLRFIRGLGRSCESGAAAWQRRRAQGQGQARPRLVINGPLVCGEVRAAMHQLVVETTTLVDLDVMEERALTLNVLQLNGQEPVRSLNLSNKGLSTVAACCNTSLYA